MKKLELIIELSTEEDFVEASKKIGNSPTYIRNVIRGYVNSSNRELFISALIDVLINRHHSALNNLMNFKNEKEN